LSKGLRGGGRMIHRRRIKVGGMCMDRFDLAVAEQLKTMDRLLYLQSEIERCQKVESQLNDIQEAANKLKELKDDIAQMKKDLRDIQLVFENQTEEAIKSYQFQESS